MAEIERAAKVSKNTVSSALYGSRWVPEPTRQRVRETAKSMAYLRCVSFAGACAGRLLDELKNFLRKYDTLVTP